MDYVDSVGACSYQDLAKLLGVSEMTIRRDVDKLVRQRGLIKTIGGIQTTHAPEHLYESPVQQRLQINRWRRSRLPAWQRRQIGPRQTIFLDGSTTCMILARHLAKKMQGLTIVTYSPLVCMEFGRADEETRSFCLGGQFDPIQCLLRRSRDGGGGPAVLRGPRVFLDQGFPARRGHVRVFSGGVPHQADCGRRGGPRDLAGGPSKFGRAAPCARRWTSGRFTR